MFLLSPSAVYRTASDQTVPGWAVDWLTETDAQGELCIRRHPQGQILAEVSGEKGNTSPVFPLSFINRNLVTRA